MADTSAKSDAASRPDSVLSNVPRAHFVEDVDTFMKCPENNTVEAALKRIDEMIQKYKFIESNLSRKRQRLKLQLPDIKQSLDMLLVLSSRKNSNEALDAQFMLDQGCYTSAVVPPTETVFLWLGANVVLEYTLDEAEKMLKENMCAAEENIKTIDGDIDFLRDQITTSEVNLARVYNWDVNRRKSQS